MRGVVPGQRQGGCLRTSPCRRSSRGALREGRGEVYVPFVPFGGECKQLGNPIGPDAADFQGIDVRCCLRHPLPAGCRGADGGVNSVIRGLRRSNRWALPSSTSQQRSLRHIPYVTTANCGPHERYNVVSILPDSMTLMTRGGESRPPCQTREPGGQELSMGGLCRVSTMEPGADEAVQWTGEGRSRPTGHGVQHVPIVISHCLDVHGILGRLCRSTARLKWPCWRDKWNY
jgi:hypothetical protein